MNDLKPSQEKQKEDAQAIKDEPAINPNETSKQYIQRKDDELKKKIEKWLLIMK